MVDSEQYLFKKITSKTFKKEIEELLTPAKIKRKENNQLSFFGEKTKVKSRNLSSEKSSSMSKETSQI